MKINLNKWQRWVILAGVACLSWAFINAPGIAVGSEDSEYKGILFGSTRTNTFKSYYDRHKNYFRVDVPRLATEVASIIFATAGLTLVLGTPRKDYNESEGRGDET